MDILPECKLSWITECPVMVYEYNINLYIYIYISHFTRSITKPQIRHALKVLLEEEEGGRRKYGN